MRIEAYTQIQQLYNSRKTTKPKTASSVSFSDQLELSSAGKDLQIAKQAVKNSPDIREELTSDIMARMQAGTYQIDSGAFADKLIQKMEEASGSI